MANFLNVLAVCPAEMQTIFCLHGPMLSGPFRSGCFLSSALVLPLLGKFLAFMFVAVEFTVFGRCYAGTEIPCLRLIK